MLMGFSRIHCVLCFVYILWTLLFWYSALQIVFYITLLFSKHQDTAASVSLHGRDEVCQSPVDWLTDWLVCSVIWSGQNPLASHLRSVQTDVASEAKDILPDTTNSASSELADGPYCVMALHWLRQMDAEMKEALLLDGAALGNGTSSSSSSTCSWIRCLLAYHLLLAHVCCRYVIVLLLSCRLAMVGLSINDYKPVWHYWQFFFSTGNQTFYLKNFTR